ncbi:oxygen-dependent protoporphyrinogen oxidase [Larkinella arboricola]|uniref:Coproporphyrinogen III oxidase n=1 Tax=Larkinella arboricola TaxID=643671 RepID=A0A327WZQ7_LARAB|nr:protoporphyrinogen oxidase [Larkinella arboricola]RAJ98060.1 oxygen-dependent protoporphyrinogen oxidase [Larkinella arboricola]
MIAIIGAGISGLTLAHELQKNHIPYRLFDRGSEPGGVMRSRREGEYLVEIGPNTLLGDADLLSWLDQLELTPEIQFAKPVSKARFIYRDGAYRQLPSGPLSLIFGQFFSWETKKALWRERSNRTVSPPGETLGDFIRRRFSSELADYVLAPFVAGTYAGDPDRLLVSETFSMLLEYEKNYGSVLKGFMKNAGSAGRRQAFTFRDGLQTLPRTLAAQLEALNLNDPVTRLTKTETDWRLEAQSGSYSADTVVLACEAEAAANLLDPTRPEVATLLRQIDYPPMTAVHSVYKRAEVQHPLNGFGGLNPRVEGRFAAGHIWNSSLFDGRCPADEVLFTSFVGGRQNADHVQHPDDVIRQRVHQELVQAFGIQASAPRRQWLSRWERAIPQYDARIVPVQEHVPGLESEGLYVCANWYRGLSLPDCIRKARTLATQLAKLKIAEN